ncbi:MAG TPA: hypothetical protein VGG89_04445 [Candidatus Baltobacteraceae bacterium]|jgi:hypothetical protein
MPTYEHRQFSPGILLVVAVTFYALYRAGLTGPDSTAHLAAFAVVAAMCIGFVQLTTRVDSRGVAWSFTIGIPGGVIAFEDIDEVQTTTMRFWEGWGIHWTILHGWLWNVAGYQGVMITKKNGRRVTLGTDDPQGLYEAILSKTS